MASKKGVAITIIILGAITGASFLVWMVPQQTQMSFVVSDYENYLDGIKERHSILDESVETEFQNLRDGSISPEEYLQIADVVSSQVTGQISEFVTSKPPTEWQESYISYMESLKNFNTYVTETKVYANMVKEGNTDNLDETLQKIQSLKSEADRLVQVSDDSRP